MCRSTRRRRQLGGRKAGKAAIGDRPGPQGQAARRLAGGGAAAEQSGDLRRATRSDSPGCCVTEGRHGPEINSGDKGGRMVQEEKRWQR